MSGAERLLYISGVISETALRSGQSANALRLAVPLIPARRAA
jgi:hypothetical protein